MTRKSDIDSVDMRLLELLQSDSRIPAADLAQQVNLSVPACYRRVQRLKGMGAVEREIAIVSPKTMGWPLSMLTLVALERDHSTVVDAFMKRIRAVPEIIEARYVTGDFDFVLTIVAKDMESYDVLTRDVLYADECVKIFKTLVVIRGVKGLSPIPGARSRLRTY